MSKEKKGTPMQSSYYVDELKKMEDLIGEASQRFMSINSELTSIGFQAEWHIKGLIYHAQNIFREYSGFGYEVAQRLSKSFSHVLIMNGREGQNLMFNFYAFINLARISLDNLKHILYPLFINQAGQLPKSITDLTSGATNCPVYERIAKTPELQYLIDLRNCLMHYRTFAPSKSAFVVMEGIEEVPGADVLQEEKLLKWTKPMTKATFRIDEEGLALNIFLPDKIFDHENGKKLVSFTYDERINIATESMRFLRHILYNYLEAFSYHADSAGKVFEFYGKKKITPVAFKKVNF